MSFRLFGRRLATVVTYRHLAHPLCYCSLLHVSFPFVNVQKATVNPSNRNILISEYSNESSAITGNLTLADYERISEDTLETLTEYFEELVEEGAHLNSPDVIYGDGVLTVQFGEPYGTYVINRQSPNLQIWLSSPTSGPKRYDFLDGHWVYRHDGVSLHDLLNEEISKILQQSVDFKRCSYSKPEKQK
ncbi:hypothetical protein R5R35_002411 [Gryllus longicercus]|uniref:ferroxidase n=1 Tax=Gryllus longicercus TaxID=2509291 RepID=A0AAN9ZEF9_9ORTH